MTVSKENKILAKRLAGVFGPDARVLRYGDDDDKVFVDVLYCENPLDRNVMFYGTVGLSDTPSFYETFIFYASFSVGKFRNYSVGNETSCLVNGNTNFRRGKSI